MKFKERGSLKVDNKGQAGYYMASCKTILVGENSIWNGGTETAQYGDTYTTIYPCYDSHGEKAFLMHDIWSPGEHCTNDGENEMVLDFYEGVRILMEKGAYAHMFEIS